MLRGFQRVTKLGHWGENTVCFFLKTSFRSIVKNLSPKSPGRIYPSSHFIILKKPSFWQFFWSSEEAKDILLYYFLILCTTSWCYFCKCFPMEGVTTFSIYIKSRNVNMNPENTCLKQWWNIFWVSTNFVTFSQKHDRK